MTGSRELEAIQGVWEHFSDEEYRRDQSHWRGHGRWKDEARWQSIGQTSLAKMRRITTHLASSSDLWSKPRTFLEWGPGGGTNMFAFRHYAERYIGIDISEKNLGECKRLAVEEGFAGFEAVHLDSDPSAVICRITKPVDAFLSTAVFQHFPSKEYGKEVLKSIYAVSNARAVGFVQIRFDDGKEKYRPIDRIEDYAKRHITATSYGIAEFNDLCESVGFRVLFISDLKSRNNYVTFNISKHD